MLCCVVLCYMTLRKVILCHFILLCHVTLCCVTPCDFVVRYIISHQYVALVSCEPIFCNVTLWTCHVILHHAKLGSVVSCYVWSILSRHVMSHLSADDSVLTTCTLLPCWWRLLELFSHLKLCHVPLSQVNRYREQKYPSDHVTCSQNAGFTDREDNCFHLPRARGRTCCAVHTKTLFCENAHVLHHLGRPSTRILKTQRLKRHFFENGCQGGEIQKRSPPVFMWTANLHTFRNDDAIAPPLDR